MHFAEYQGVYFIEGRPPEAAVLGSVSGELNGFLSQNQLKTLDDVKEKMRARVLAGGGNCVVDFQYGQRSTFWKSFLGMDDVLWYGSGLIAQIDPAVLEKYRRG